ncbi:MAG TPA: DUF4384 domain-containing protein [Pyrinomonadaceae bacterium]|jgi:hypothetical protein|nr:DUF4384 domain-containing protein [Pyrinomonadaceae bacterium]
MKTRSAIPQGLFLSFILSLAAVCVHAQDDTATREITSLDFQNQRQKPAGGSAKITLPKNATPKQKKNIAVLTNNRRKYALVKRIPTTQTTVAARIDKNPKISNKAAIKSEQIGVTFWRLRPVAADDGDVPYFSVRIGDTRENWTAERVNSTTRFKTGDRVRFTIESSRSGYLYIINREYYTDGTTGAASIIFPTVRTRGGDNQVVAGSLVDVPASTDNVPYFTIKPKRRDYAGEELVVLITNEKLPLEIGLKPVALDVPQLEKWSSDWSATVDIYDAEDGEGAAMTNVELAASQTSSRALEQEEPLPQTIYKVQISGDLPLFVPFRMSAVP